jgi:hypothetical protein
MAWAVPRAQNRRSMHVIHLFGFVAALGFIAAPYAHGHDERGTLFPDTVKPKPDHPKRHHPYSGQPQPSRPPQRTYIEREREYEPRPRPRASTPEKPVAPAVRTQSTRTTAKPPERDAALARCDDLRGRMERAMRNESRSGDERRAIYQEQLRAGCT